MSHKLTFGKYMGKTFEWVVFHHPNYAQWIIENSIHRQEHNMDAVEGDCFAELYRRIAHLGGICCQCHERPVTCMGLSTHHRSGAVGAVGFYCEECQYQGGTPTGYFDPSILVDAYNISAADQQMIIHEVRRHYIGEEGNLTQKRLEGFFQNDANFSRFTPSFFTSKEVAA